MTTLRIRDRIFAPWERAFERLATPFEDFIEEEASGGIMLLACTIAALVAANSPVADHYLHFVHGYVRIDVLGWTIEKTVHHWVNDGLMALFFFVVGLEIKRELMTGELADPRRAALPIVAGVGGMAGPALIYMLQAGHGVAANGWGIPMATDIAFAVGAVVLLGERVPKTLLTFLVALAIVDDLGALIVVALFYTAKIHAAYVAAGGVFLLLLVLCNRIGVRTPIPYFVIGLCLWLALLKSGLHATLAGVLTAFTIPSRPKYDPELLSHRVRRLMDLYERTYESVASVHRSQRLRSILGAMDSGVRGVRSPAYRLEHGLHVPVAFAVVPLFAFVNAGIPFDAGVFRQALSHSVTYGVASGLVLGKFFGIMTATWIMVRLGWGVLPSGTGFKHIAGAGLLAGIGFTMSIFIAELAFPGDETLVLFAKIGIFAASILSGCLGIGWLWRCSLPFPLRQGAG